MFKLSYFSNHCFSCKIFVTIEMDSNYRNELQSELRNELNKCRSKYQNLITMSSSVQTEIEECNEHYISCWLQYHIIDHSLMGTSSKSAMITRRFYNRFKFGETNIGSNGKNNRHKYNYGDVVYDHKFAKHGIVVNELKVYVTLWYYEVDGDELETRNRKKSDDKLQVLKRCTMVF